MTSCNTPQSARRRKMPFRLGRRRRLAHGQIVRQIPPAQWAAGRYRVHNAAKCYTFGIGTSSHCRPPSRCANARQSFQSEAAQKVTLARSSQSNELLFPLSQIDFSSSSVTGTVALHQPEPVASPTIEWLRETKTARSSINNRLTDAQRGRGRRRGNVEDMQHLTGRHELEIVDQSSVGLQGLRAHA